VSEWQSLRLRENHGWKSKPGYCICVLDRGAIRFDFPCDWKLTRDSDAVRIRDREHPDDNCVLAVSSMKLPPVALMVPLAEMIDGLVGQEEEHEILERNETVESSRLDGVEIAWAETRYTDPKEKRDISARLCIARGSGIHCLITFDCWTDMAGQFQGVWAELLRSLQFDLPVQDPTLGPVVH
jgi:hypothetical protein